MLEFSNTAPGIAARLRNGSLLPYLGPGIAALSDTAIPTSYEALAAWLGSKVALPRRARGNAWAAAQFIESFKHRTTLDTLMATAFASPVQLTALHAAIARVAPALVVDTWYDAALRSAFVGASSWGEIHAASRAKPGESRWYRAYDSTGSECAVAQAEAWSTLIYKPHGCVTPAPNFLISDADYVEVLTEIDIQTPIPDTVKTRRAEGGFLFLGCRFHDQTLRTYARQIAKRSAGAHVVVVDSELSRNEQKFLEELGASVVQHDLAAFAMELADNL
ncbi:MAG: SIR2 family protein [Acetobacteraceae bacterium]|nr:SIR2 family protein [Acetobacteraceae bacterium]